MATVLNGRLPSSQLATIPGTSERVRLDLLAQTVALRNAFRARFDKELRITDAYRDYDAQVRVKQQKGWLAATPGYSNHGWGQAIDFGSRVEAFGTEEYNWMKANAPRFGWTHPSWAEPGGYKPEPWHWEGTWVPVTNYTNIPGGNVITPVEDEMASADIARLEAKVDNLVAYMFNGGGDVPNSPGNPGSLLDRVQRTLENVNGLPTVLQQILANVSGVPNVLAELNQDIDKVSSQVGEVAGVLYTGTAGTKWEETIYQRVKRIEEQTK